MCACERSQLRHYNLKECTDNSANMYTSIKLQKVKRDHVVFFASSVDKVKTKKNSLLLLHFLFVLSIFYSRDASRR